ncbi:MAG: hypothetical protein AB7S75_03990 [Desulfococcaceae bacterium]
MKENKIVAFIPLLRKFDGTATNFTNDRIYVLCIRAGSCYSWLFKVISENKYTVSVHRHRAKAGSF